MFKRFFTSLWNFIKRLFTYLGVIAFICGIIYLFRIPLMGEMGDFLIAEDPILRANAIVVLAGAPFERCGEAAKLYRQDVAGKIITTGEYANSSAALMNKALLDDAHLGRMGLMNLGIDSTKIMAIPQGTSTYEEARVMLAYSKQENYKRIVVVTTLHHSHRVHSVFAKKFKNSGIEVIVRGCPPLNYKPEKWWEYEEGMMFVINEYIKWAYYIFKGRIF